MKVLAKLSSSVKILEEIICPCLPNSKGQLISLAHSPTIKARNTRPRNFYCAISAILGFPSLVRRPPVLSTLILS